LAVFANGKSLTWIIQELGRLRPHPIRPEPVLIDNFPLCQRTVFAPINKLLFYSHCQAKPP
jgi:hypothetical protein